MLVLIVLPFIAIQQASFPGGIETISYPGCDYRMVIVTFPISTVSDLFMIMAAAIIIKRSLTVDIGKVTITIL